MSNEYIDLCRLFTSTFFHGVPPANVGGIWQAFIDFDAEVAGVSTQAAVWVSASPSGARTPSGGSRQFRTLGPTVSFSGGDGNRDLARSKAVIGLLDQLIASVFTPQAIASSTYPATGPIVVATQVAHGFISGQLVTVAGHLTNTGANGTFPITVIDTTHIQLNGSSIVAAQGVGGATGTCTLVSAPGQPITYPGSVYGSGADHNA